MSTINFHQFSIDPSDYDSAEDFTQALNLLIWDNSPGTVPASKCEECDHVAIGAHFTTCPECDGSALILQTGVTMPTIADTDEIPSRYLTGDELDTDYFDFKEELEKSPHDYGVFEAALELDIEPENVDEAYAGEFKSDEEFAQQLAEDLGEPAPTSWPYTCIDWERAARDLMYDYSESNGHYFRNL
jgi:antirestriction protein